MGYDRENINIISMLNKFQYTAPSRDPFIVATNGFLKDIASAFGLSPEACNAESTELGKTLAISVETPEQIAAVNAALAKRGINDVTIGTNKKLGDVIRETDVYALAA